MVGSPAIATASYLTRTSVCELIDGFAEPLWMAPRKTVVRWFTDRLCMGPASRNRNREVLASPGAHNKPEFGPCMRVAATLLTDWGPTIHIDISCHA
jgi:hypothetical protein